jgi:hypothetical protein
MRIIAISGKKQSGKDTAAKIMSRLLLQNTTYYPIHKKFSEGLKEAAAVILRCDVDDFEYEDTKNTPAAVWLPADLTKRKFLQLLGTNVAHQIDPAIWVNRTLYNLESQAKKIQEAVNREPIYIFTDVRFPLEANRLLEMGADLLRIHCPLLSTDDTAPSETALDNYSFPTILVNNKVSKEALKQQLTDYLVAKNYLDRDTLNKQL